MYGVSDVRTWVKGNCAFAKMYLPQVRRLGERSENRDRVLGNV